MKTLRMIWFLALFLPVCYSYAQSVGDNVICTFPSDDLTEGISSAQQLFRVTGDALDEGAFFDIQVEMNDGISAMLLFKNGELVAKHDISVLMAGNVVLVRASNKDAILLHAYNFSPKTGGPVRMTYLYDGIKDEYRTFDLAVEVNSESARALSGGTPFSRMNLFKRTKFGRIIGIDRVEVAP